MVLRFGLEIFSSGTQEIKNMILNKQKNSFNLGIGDLATRKELCLATLIDVTLLMLVSNRICTYL